MKASKETTQAAASITKKKEKRAWWDTREQLDNDLEVTTVEAEAELVTAEVGANFDQRFDKIFGFCAKLASASALTLRL